MDVYLRAVIIVSAENGEISIPKPLATKIANGVRDLEIAEHFSAAAETAQDAETVLAILQVYYQHESVCLAALRRWRSLYDLEEQQQPRVQIEIVREIGMNALDLIFTCMERHPKSQDVQDAAAEVLSFVVLHSNLYFEDDTDEVNDFELQLVHNSILQTLSSERAVGAILSSITAFPDREALFKSLLYLYGAVNGRGRRESSNWKGAFIDNLVSGNVLSLVIASTESDAVRAPSLHPPDSEYMAGIALQLLWFLDCLLEDIETPVIAEAFDCDTAARLVAAIDEIPDGDARDRFKGMPILHDLSGSLPSPLAAAAAVRQDDDDDDGASQDEDRGRAALPLIRREKQANPEVSVEASEMAMWQWMD